ncbi:MAG: hypothetical protein LBD94_01785, partial [Rickettsiales bacterium]|nr:hypothetical protein [Rickettsiales bacterium]
MICQITNPTKMIETLASLIIKDGTDLSDVLVFVPTRRAGRKLEKFLSDKFDGAAIMPKIVGLGEGDDSADDTDAAGKTERKIILAKILLSVADKIGVPCSFGGALSVAGELLVLQDYLENDGIDARDIDWNNMIPDERKAAFLNLLKNVDIGPTATQVRNNGIRNWKNHLSEYRSVFCCGSTASVKPTRDLMDEIARMPNGYVILPGLVSDSNDIGRADPYWSVKKFLAGRKIETIDVGGAEKMTFFNNCFNNDLSGKTLKGPENIIQIDCDTESEEAASVAMVSAMAKASGQSVLIITPDVSGEQRIKAALSGYGLSADSSGGVPLSQTQIGRFSGLVFDYLNGDENRDVIAADLRQIVGAKNIAVLDKLKYDGNLFDFLITAANKLNYEIGDIATAEVFFDKVLELSNMAEKYGLDFSDVSSVFSEVMKSETVRAPMSDDYDVAILGTAEARMQTADVVILTGLNDGMFPSDGFRHSWLPRNIARKIGL